MFGLGTGELVIVLILALIFIGPERMPQMASKLGVFVRKVRKTVDDIKNELRGPE